MRTVLLGFLSGLPYRRHQSVKKGASTGSPQLLALAGMGTATAAAAAALVAEDIHKSFGDLEVLKGVSLTAREGDVIAMLGSSGSGKSTFLRCMNLLERPNAGRIRSEEHTSELQSLMRISYAVFCLKKKKINTLITQ